MKLRCQTLRRGSYSRFSPSSPNSTVVRPTQTGWGQLMADRETVPGAWPRLAALAAAGAAALPFAAEMRLARPTQPLTDRWRQRPVAPRGATLLGISLRPRQIEALGLDA